MCRSKKLKRVYTGGFSFVCCKRNFYRSALILRNLPCSERFLVASLSTEFYTCLHNNSNDFGQASVGGVINVISVLNHYS